MKGHFGGLGELEFWAPCCGGGEQILCIEDGVRPGTEVGRLWQREGDPFPRREEQFGWAFGCEVFCVHFFFGGGVWVQLMEFVLS